ncbi:MAG: DUF1559 domain-containing protein [Pirellulales bacterium]
MAENNQDSTAARDETNLAAEPDSAGGDRFWKQYFQLFLAILFFYLVLFCLIPAPGNPGTPLIVNCRENLSAIGKALQSYQQVHGCLPPAYVADSSGRPIHSWRALILPQFEAPPFDDRYHFEEPWDGPANRRLGRVAERRLRCLRDAGLRTDTSYLAVVGPDAGWTGAEPRRSTEMAPDTILLSEVPQSGVGWLEPRDLSPDDLRRLSKAIRDGAQRGNHADGFHVLLADFTVRFLPNDLEPAKLEAMLTIEADGDASPAVEK